MTTISDISSIDAWALLKEHENATLVDVRTPEEWSSVGKADLTSLNKKVVLISWLFFPDKNLNSNFVTELQALVSKKDTPVFFICKSGIRSEAAAKCAIDNGYTKCFNVIDGFEGSSSVLKGWRGNLLPTVKGSV